ncbi:2-phospho-L-lactate transferase [Chloropicon primus]|uniref:2-phospho-L-lactate transferase n=1 Tax=Chloropicon primus TaxID=1764295 RepID=A0A5B8MUP7_9CHLO|nr:2-phospho-L-lactate transferase [Chloropicon primus]UPR02426.1 2-phospho-L-lactate transferase [Chloropicon primus]|eukprot:QDZ23212.1 2-phospho-L-lactate transferase [Chloropicon primus]
MVLGDQQGMGREDYLVFSGGTALNSCARHLRPPSLSSARSVTHVLPVSDDGGSTAEIVRVLGGPAVGDIRSRCLRLSSESTGEARAVNALLGHRLCSRDSDEAKAEWYRVVEGDHELWEEISEPYKNTIRAFLVHFQQNILRQSSMRFDFANGSIGNYFFAGARIFFRSLEAAIFLYSRVSGIPENCLVLPCVCTEDRLVLGAELEDGTVIRGQNEISHPKVMQSPMSLSEREYGGGANLGVTKAAAEQPLDSPIRRVMYLSYEGATHEHEIVMRANERVLDRLREATCVVYGMGSFYTSLCPSLILQGVGEAIAERGEGVKKILLLNGWHDREISGYTATDCVNAVCSSLNRRESGRNGVLTHSPSEYITHVLVPRHGSVYDPSSDLERLSGLGVRVVEVDSFDPEGNGQFRFETQALVEAIDGIVSPRGAG